MGSVCLHSPGHWSLFNDQHFVVRGLEDMKGRVVWVWRFVQIVQKTLHLVCLCIFMRLKFLVDPKAREKDLEEVTKSYDLPPEGLKYIEWRNAYTVSNFFYTWNMVHDFFLTQLQDINKVATLYSPAPNPALHHPVTGDKVPLLSVASSQLPLVINFGSCT